MSTQPELLWLHETYRQLAAHEDELINHRLALFLALVTADGIVGVALIQFVQTSQLPFWIVTAGLIFLGAAVSLFSYVMIARTFASQWLWRWAASEVEKRIKWDAIAGGLQEISAPERGPLKARLRLLSKPEPPDMLSKTFDLTMPFTLHSVVLNPKPRLPPRFRLSPTESVPRVPFYSLIGWFGAAYVWAVLFLLKYEHLYSTLPRTDVILLIGASLAIAIVILVLVSLWLSRDGESRESHAARGSDGMNREDGDREGEKSPQPRPESEEIDK